MYNLGATNSQLFFNEKYLAIVKMERNHKKYQIISFSQSTQNLMLIILYKSIAGRKWTPVSRTKKMAVLKFMDIITK